MAGPGLRRKGLTHLNLSKNLALWVVIAILLVALYNLFGGMAGGGGQGDRSYSDFLTAVDAGQVTEVVIDRDNITWKDQGTNTYTTTKPDDPALIQQLHSRDVNM